MRMRRSSTGAAMAELVIIAPLLLLVLLGLIQAGDAGDFAIKVGNAARAGVQYGAQNHVTAADAAGMETAATNDANTSGVTAVASYFCQCEDLTASTCGAVGACSSNHQNLYVKVVVTGTMASLLNYALIPAGLRTITLTRTATMRVTQ
jgi:Flp pilus assembly protein TadG